MIAALKRDCPYIHLVVEFDKIPSNSYCVDYHPEKYVRHRFAEVTTSENLPSNLGYNVNLSRNILVQKRPNVAARMRSVKVVFVITATSSVCNRPYDMKTCGETLFN